MQVNIGRIRGDHGASIPLNIYIDQPEAVISQLKFIPGTPLRIDGSVTNTGNGYLVTGTIRADLDLECGRCLNDYAWQLEVQLCERFCVGEKPEAFPEIDEEEEESEDDEFDETHYFLGDQFDLTEAVQEQILVSLPMKRLCQPDCAGLCSMCGANLAEQSCTCQEDTVDIRLAPLANWLEAHGEPEKADDDRDN